MIYDHVSISYQPQSEEEAEALQTEISEEEE